MKRILLAAVLLCTTFYNFCPEPQSFMLWKDPVDSAWKVSLVNDKSQLSGTIGDDNQDGARSYPDVIFSSTKPRYMQIADGSGVMFHFMKDPGSLKANFYDLQTIKSKKNIEQQTLKLVTAPELTTLISSYESAPEEEPETVTSAGPKLSGIKLVKFSGKPDCIGMKIEYEWPRPKTANTIHFYSDNKSYYCFSNTFLDASQDPKLTGNKKIATTIDGVAWRATEYYFQAQKFQDPAAAYKEMTTKNVGPGSLPGVVNGSNKKIKLNSTKKYEKNDLKWFAISDQVMLKAIRAKFTQNIDLKDVLLNTYPKMVIEDTIQASYTEIIWGAGENYTGCNLLGQILMHVRQELYDGQFYVFKKGDAKHYYDLLSGQTDWTPDNNPEQRWIPDGYTELLGKIHKTQVQKKPTVKTSTPADLMHLAKLLKQLGE